MAPLKVPQTGFAAAIAVLESTISAEQSARETLASLGYRVAIESSEEAIERRVMGADPPAILLLALPECSNFLRRIAKAPRMPLVIASLSGPLNSALTSFQEADCELFTLRPHSRDSMAPVFLAASKLWQSRKRVQAQLAVESRLRDRLRDAGQSSELSGFQHIDFFKKLLVLEIKRAKRYGYSIALCLVSMDEPEIVPDKQTMESLRSKVADSIRHCIRDIDIPVDASEGRMLLFLPYTDTHGAKELSDRVVRRVRRDAVIARRGKEFSMTVSIGVTSLQDEEKLSFSKLLKDASAALRAAQLKGGNRALCRQKISRD